MPIDPVFRKQTKDALEHLYDTAYLETHPLLSQIVLGETANRTSRVQKLREVLKDFIESLRPQQNLPADSPEWRSYRALRCRFVQGMSIRQVEVELGISQRQLQREFHKGIDALAVLLWDLRGDKPVLDSETLDDDEIEELQEELSQWVIQRNPCAVQTLFNDLSWKLKPVLVPESDRLTIDLPEDLPQVNVDATLTRQAIYSLTRLVLQQEPGKITITAGASDRSVDLLIHFGQNGVNQNEADWRIAEMLIGEQGGRLAQTSEIRADQATAVTLITVTLPRPEQGLALITDDNQALHQLFERYLAPYRFTVLHAYNGHEALALAREKHPDFITLDVMMASMDGWQVLRALQENPETSAIPVIVCSVLKEPQLAISLGAKAYLKKPVERLHLQAMLEHLGLTGSSPEKPPAEPPQGS